MAQLGAAQHSTAQHSATQHAVTHRIYDSTADPPQPCPPLPCPAAPMPFPALPYPPDPLALQVSLSRLLHDNLSAVAAVYEDRHLLCSFGPRAQLHQCSVKARRIRVS